MKLLSHLLSGTLCLLFVFSACQSDAVITDRERDVAASIARKAGAYYQFTGRLGELPVTMELRLDPAMPGDNYYQGYYRYDSLGGPIELYGYQDSLGMLTLKEEGSYNNEPHRLVGRFDPQEGFIGEWYSGNGHDVYAFDMQLSKTPRVFLEQWCYSDSLVAFPDWPASPSMAYQLEWLVPTGDNLSKTQRIFLQKAIAEGLTTQKVKASDRMEDLIARERNQYEADFRAELMAMIEEGILDTSELTQEALYHYAHSTTMQLYFNHWPLLTVGYTDYDYQGGAHGMYGTRVASYNVERAQQLTLKDILLPGYEARVGEVLARAIRTKFNLSRGEPLSAVLFDDAISPSDNFGLTDKGIFFVYPPYDIAPYAAGEIELFVPFVSIEQVVKEEWLPVEEDATL